MKQLGVLALTMFLFACSDTTAPVSAPATIIFRAGDGCPTQQYYFLIDGQIVDQPVLAARDSSKHDVTPGEHTAGYITVDGLLVSIGYPRVVDLKPTQRYVQTLSCQESANARATADR